ncbi:MAG: hypothetical protein JHC93_07225, partial [Parachlamydiales bacterium]|nr:hypothetical protein [Parachlamydiales bacterium]
MANPINPHSNITPPMPHSSKGKEEVPDNLKSQDLQNIENSAKKLAGVVPHLIKQNDKSDPSKYIDNKINSRLQYLIKFEQVGKTLSQSWHKVNESFKYENIEEFKKAKITLVESVLIGLLEGNDINPRINNSEELAKQFYLTQAENFGRMSNLSKAADELSANLEINGLSEELADTIAHELADLIAVAKQQPMLSKNKYIEKITSPPELSAVEEKQAKYLGLIEELNKINKVTVPVITPTTIQRKIPESTRPPTKTTTSTPNKLVQSNLKNPNPVTKTSIPKTPLKSSDRISFYDKDKNYHEFSNYDWLDKPIIIAGKNLHNSETFFHMLKFPDNEGWFFETAGLKGNDPNLARIKAGEVLKKGREKFDSNWNKKVEYSDSIPQPHPNYLN